LAQGTRLEILTLVAEAGGGGLAAGDIARAIGCPASTLSFHLKELSRTGVLSARPKGRHILYALHKEVLQALARFIDGLAGAEPRGRPARGAGARPTRRPTSSISRSSTWLRGAPSHAVRSIVSAPANSFGSAAASMRQGANLPASRAHCASRRTQSLPVDIAHHSTTTTVAASNSAISRGSKSSPGMSP
jgi:DNA-binding transcriptional ArsR family regulator